MVMGFLASMSSVLVMGIFASVSSLALFSLEHSLMKIRLINMSPSQAAARTQKSICSHGTVRNLSNEYLKA